MLFVTIKRPSSSTHNFLVTIFKFKDVSEINIFFSFAALPRGHSKEREGRCQSPFMGGCGGWPGIPAGTETGSQTQRQVQVIVIFFGGGTEARHYAEVSGCHRSLIWSIKHFGTWNISVYFSGVCSCNWLDGNPKKTFGMLELFHGVF